MATTAIGATRTFALGLVMSLGVLLGGCFDLDTEIRFNANGTGDTKVRFGFDPEMAEVFKFIETVGKYSTDPAAAALSTGVCSDALLVKAPPQIRRNTRVRRYKQDDQIFCEVAHHVGTIAPKGPLSDPQGAFVMERSGPRRWQIRLDLERVPDLTPAMMMGMMAQLQKNPMFGPRLRAFEMMDIVEAGKRANVALAAILMRGRTLRLTISAPRIVSSQGAFEASDRAVTFQFRFDEFVNLLINAEARRGKFYSVEVEY